MRSKKNFSHDGLPLLRVNVLEPGQRGRSGWDTCVIGEQLNFDDHRLMSYCLGSWNTRIHDALVLTAAVEFCDHSRARSKVNWPREIFLRLPVHEETHWKSQAVSEKLHTALRFLTGDKWTVEFVKRSKSKNSPERLNFSMPDNSAVVIPYSNGLDSWAVSGLMEKKFGDRLIRVRLGSRNLGGETNASGQPPFALLPYKVRYRGRSVESSSRSRGFKFAMLSAIAACLLGTETIVVPESGQGALGPVLASVGQAYPDFRNHPSFTNLMSEFIDALLEHRVEYQFPRLWHTKGETLGEYIDQKGVLDDWRETWSCWRSSLDASVDGKKRQCGICAACMLRRMSLHTAKQKEESSSYVWESLDVEEFTQGAAPEFKGRERDLNRQYGIAGVLHMDDMARLVHSKSAHSVLKRRAAQLGRALKIPEAEVAAKTESMLNRHAKEWASFVDFLGPQSFVAQWAGR